MARRGKGGFDSSDFFCVCVLYSIYTSVYTIAVGWQSTPDDPAALIRWEATKKGETTILPLLGWAGLGWPYKGMKRKIKDCFFHPFLQPLAHRPRLPLTSPSTTKLAHSLYIPPAAADSYTCTHYSRNCKQTRPREKFPMPFYKQEFKTGSTHTRFL